MSTSTLGATLRSARIALGLTQRDLAIRAGVSERLLREVELGVRPNVSLESAVLLFAHVGVSMRLAVPSGVSVTIRTKDIDAIAQRARAENRRRTWSGRQLTGLDSQNDAPAGIPRTGGIAAVATVSDSAHSITRATARGATVRRGISSGR